MSLKFNLSLIFHFVCISYFVLRKSGITLFTLFMRSPSWNIFNSRNRYAQLVDNVFPTKAKPNYNQENVDKLLFFVLSSPQKLDRIAFRLYSNMLNYLKNKRVDMVIIAADVMNQLLNTSRTSFINLMINSYLKMILKMLEDENPVLRLHAAKSFGKFSKLDAETPCFYEYVDKFVEQFVLLCSSTAEDHETTCNLHLSGLVGIQGLIFKSSSAPSSQNTIWSGNFLNKIVPAIIDNLREIVPTNNSLNALPTPMGEEIRPFFSDIVEIQEINGSTIRSTQYSEKSEIFSGAADPFSCNYKLIALYDLHELLHLSNMSSSRYVIASILKYWTTNNYWHESSCSRRILQLISCSLQPQLEHIFIQLYFEHINDNKNNMKNIMDMILTVPHAFIEPPHISRGSLYLDILSNLINCLKDSTSLEFTVAEIELYQESLLKILEVFYNKLPTFQKSETFFIIMNKLSATSKALTIFTLQSYEEFVLKIPSIFLAVSKQELKEYEILIKCLQLISMSYKIKDISAILDLASIEQLFSLVFIPSSYGKIMALKVFINIFDTQNNTDSILTCLKNDEFHADTFAFLFDNNFGEIAMKKLLLILHGIISLLSLNEEIELEIYKEITIFICICCSSIKNETFYKEILNLLINTQENLYYNAETHEHRFYVPFQALLLSISLCINMNVGIIPFQKLCFNVKESRQKIHPYYGLPCCLLDQNCINTDLSEASSKDTKSCFFYHSQIMVAFSKDGQIPINQMQNFVKASSIDGKSRTEEDSHSSSSTDNDISVSLNKTHLTSNDQSKENTEDSINKNTSMTKHKDGLILLEQIASGMTEEITKSQNNKEEEKITKRSTFYANDEYFT